MNDLYRTNNMEPFAAHEMGELKTLRSRMLDPDEWEQLGMKEAIAPDYLVDVERILDLCDIYRSRLESMEWQTNNVLGK